MEELCLNCGKALFNKLPLDDEGHWAMDQKTPLPVESDEADLFFVCPHCSAKNVIVDTATSADLPQIRISHVKK